MVFTGDSSRRGSNEIVENESPSIDDRERALFIALQTNGGKIDTELSESHWQLEQAYRKNLEALERRAAELEALKQENARQTAETVRKLANLEEVMVEKGPDSKPVGIGLPYLYGRTPGHLVSSIEDVNPVALKRDRTTYTEDDAEHFETNPALSLNPAWVKIEKLITETEDQRLDEKTVEELDSMYEGIQHELDEFLRFMLHKAHTYPPDRSRGLRDRDRYSGADSKNSVAIISTMMELYERRKYILKHSMTDSEYISGNLIAAAEVKSITESSIPPREMYGTNYEYMIPLILKLIPEDGLLLNKLSVTGWLNIVKMRIKYQAAFAESAKNVSEGTHSLDGFETFERNMLNLVSTEEAG
jgi:hypothetical protein